MAKETEDDIPSDARDFKAPVQVDEEQERALIERGREWSRQNFPSAEDVAARTKGSDQYETRLADYLPAAEAAVLEFEQKLKEIDEGEPGGALVLDHQRGRIYFDDLDYQDTVDSANKYPDLVIRLTPESRTDIVRKIAQAMLNLRTKDMTLVPPASPIDRKRV